MKKVKITINSEDRVVVIPMQYNVNNDTLDFSELQIEPIPNEKDDISKDIVLILTQTILSTLKGLNND